MRGQKTYTRLEIAQTIIIGTPLTIPNETWARSQIDGLIKYQTMSTPRLARKFGLPEKVVANFKKTIKNRKISG